MPPQPARYVGRAASGEFPATVPAGGRLDRVCLVPTLANRLPTLATYERAGEAGPFLAHWVIVHALARDAIASIVRFGDPDLVARCGLPMTLPERTGV